MDKVQLELEEKYSKKWNSISQSDDELKKIAMDLYNGEIYTDRQCKPHEITQRFMVLLFMAPHISPSTDTKENRDSKIYDILEKEIEGKYYDHFISNIGLIYEYLDKRGPMALNGGPIFMSCRFLTKENTTKMFEFYNEYKELRELVDKF